MFNEYIRRLHDIAPITLMKRKINRNYQNNYSIADITIIIKFYLEKANEIFCILMINKKRN